MATVRLVPARPRRAAKLRWKRARACLLALVVLGAGVWAWPRPDAGHLAEANGQALKYLVGRYADDHAGKVCRDLGTLVEAAEAGGYNMRVKNPYSGVIASFDDPAIARPLALRRGEPAEAGLVFYQARPDALGRVFWEIEVATDHGALRPLEQATTLVARGR